MENITICQSCRIGCGNTADMEIEKQKEKYNGIYICKNCEDSVEILSSGEFGSFKNEGRRCLVTSNGVYIDKGLKPRNTKWLGFGGRLFLIIETVKDGFLTNKKVYLTNDLYQVRSIHPCLKDIYKHNINAEIINVDWDNFDILKTQLDKM